jgi:hypothetical protein
LYALGDRLHKTVGEILRMPMAEFTGWLAYFKLLKNKPT